MPSNTPSYLALYAIDDDTHRQMSLSVARQYKRIGYSAHYWVSVATIQAKKLYKHLEEEFTSIEILQAAIEIAEHFKDLIEGGV